MVSSNLVEIITNLGDDMLEVGEFFKNAEDVVNLGKYKLNADIIKVLLKMNIYARGTFKASFLNRIIIQMIINDNYEKGLFEEVMGECDSSWGNLIYESMTALYGNIIMKFGIEKLYGLVSGSTSEEIIYNKMDFLVHADRDMYKNFIDRQIKKILLLTPNKEVWQMAINSNQLDENFIINNLDKIDISDVGAKGKFFIRNIFLDKYASKVNWDNLMENNCFMSIDIKHLIAYKNKINWNKFSKKSKISKEMMKEFKDYLNWNEVLISNFDTFMGLDKKTINYLVQNKISDITPFIIENPTTRAFKKFKEYIDWDAYRIYSYINITSVLNSELINYINFRCLFNQGRYKYQDLYIILEYYKNFIGHCEINGIDIDNLYTKKKFINSKGILTSEEINLIKEYDRIKLYENDCYYFTIDEFNLIKFEDILDFKKLRYCHISTEYFISNIDKFDLNKVGGGFKRKLSLEDKKIIISKYDYKTLDKFNPIIKSQQKELMDYAKNIGKY